MRGRILGMDTSQSPRVTHVERMNGGVIIVFDNQVCAMYSSALLYETLGKAVIVEEPEEE